MTRWKIRKFPADDDFFGPDGLLWVAWRTGKWTECRAFSTHAEALSYADEQARTITVTLPRDIDFTGLNEPDAAPLKLRLRESGAVDIESGWTIMGIGNREVEPLALALLAHTRRRHDRP